MAMTGDRQVKNKVDDHIYIVIRGVVVQNVEDGLRSDVLDATLDWNRDKVRDLDRKRMREGRDDDDSV
jgi:ribosomal protein S12